MANDNGFDGLLDDLMSENKSPEELAQALFNLKEELANAPMYLRAGKSFRALKFSGRAKINGVAVTCYSAAEKVDNEGKKVEPKPRAANAGTPGRKKKTT